MLPFATSLTSTPSTVVGVLDATRDALLATLSFCRAAFSRGGKTRQDRLIIKNRNKFYNFIQGEAQCEEDDDSKSGCVAREDQLPTNPQRDPRRCNAHVLSWSKELPLATKFVGLLNTSAEMSKRDRLRPEERDVSRFWFYRIPVTGWYHSMKTLRQSVNDSTSFLAACLAAERR